MELSPKESIEAAILKLKEGGHSVQTQMRGVQGEQWFEIDGHILVSWEKMQAFGTGTYTFDELRSKFTRDDAAI